ncbi:MAG TPA: response regulator [Edaphobacter sp.]|jgi:response regulator RpfG family c-di-GMP phosphodiesterase|nr:response regulator [Edaphobacter sp.]
MNRPCFLVIDREFPGSISTRKLVIETAKFNVITAYSGKEAVELAIKFPSVNGVVLDGGIQDMRCEEVVHQIKALQPTLPVIVILTPGFDGSPQSDYQLDSYDPARLLQTLRELKPEVSAALQQHDAELSREKF